VVALGRSIDCSAFALFLSNLSFGLDFFAHQPGGDSTKPLMHQQIAPSRRRRGYTFDFKRKCFIKKSKIRHADPYLKLQLPAAHLRNVPGI